MARLLLKDNFSMALSAGKAYGVAYLSVASGGGAFATAFGSSGSMSPVNDSLQTSVVVPITVVDSAGEIVVSGFVTSWDFGATPTQLQIDSGLKEATIPSGCTIHSRIRADFANDADAQYFDHYRIWSTSSNIDLTRPYSFIDSPNGQNFKVKLPVASHSTPSQALTGISKRIEVVFRSGNTGRTVTVSAPPGWSTLYASGQSSPFTIPGYAGTMIATLTGDGNWFVRFEA